MRAVRVRRVCLKNVASLECFGMYDMEMENRKRSLSIVLIQIS